MKRLVIHAVLLLCSQYAFCQSKSDSLQQILTQAKEEEKVEILQEVILKLWLNHPDSAMIYAKEAVRIANALGDDKYKAIATRLIGGVYYYLGDYDSTILYSHRAYELSLKVNDSTLMASCQNNLGLSYYSVGSYPEALENLLRALNLKKRINQEYGMTQTLNNVGLVYLELHEFDRALDYFNQAYSLAKQNDDKNIILYSSNNIGFTFYRQEKYEESEKYYLQSLEVAKDIDNVIWHAAAFSGLGDVYLATDRISEAKKSYEASLEMRRRINEKNGIAEIYASYSEIYAKKKKLDSAFYFLHASQRIATQINARDLIIANYKLFHDFFVLSRQYDSALFYQTKFIALRDSVLNENLARNIGDIQLQIKEEESRYQLATKDAEIRRKTIISYLLIAVVAMAVVFSFFWYRSFRRQRLLANDLEKKNKEVQAQADEIHKQKEALELSNSQLELAQEKIGQQNEKLSILNTQLQNTVVERTKELEQANKELKVVNLELDNFIYKSSHDIKGPLVRLLGVCHVALLDVHDEVAREYFSMLYETARHLNEIFDRLKVVSDINTMQLSKEPISFQDIIATVKKNLKRIDGFAEIDIQTTINLNSDYESDAFLIETIFHNMIENAVRFQKKSEAHHKYIKVEVERSNGSLLISFKDNGIGIKQTDIDHIFRMFSKAALEHQTVGLGLYIVKQCVGKLNGSVSLVQSDQQETEFEVRLPFDN